MNGRGRLAFLRSCRRSPRGWSREPVRGGSPHGGRLHSARVTYAGRRAHLSRGARWHARIDLRGTRRRAVTVHRLHRSGRTLRETRTYRTCAPGRFAVLATNDDPRAKPRRDP